MIGTVTRINRTAASLSLLTVDGSPCRPDFIGVIRGPDVRQTAKDTVKIWNCFRPGDVVRAQVVSIFFLFCVFFFFFLEREWRQLTGSV